MLEGTWVQLGRRSLFAVAALLALGCAWLSLSESLAAARASLAEVESAVAKREAAAQRVPRLQLEVKTVYAVVEESEKRTRNPRFLAVLKAYRGGKRRWSQEEQRFKTDYVKKHPAAMAQMEAAARLALLVQDLEYCQISLLELTKTRSMEAVARSRLARLRPLAGLVGVLLALAVALVIVLDVRLYRAASDEYRLAYKTLLRAAAALAVWLIGLLSITSGTLPGWAEAVVDFLLVLSAGAALVGVPLALWKPKNERRPAWRLIWLLLPSGFFTGVSGLAALVWHDYSWSLAAAAGLPWCAYRFPARAEAAFASGPAPWSGALGWLLAQAARPLRSLELMFFNDFLCASLERGLPLAESLEVYAESRRGAFKRALLAAALQVRQGKPLSRALSAPGLAIPSAYLAMAKAGEEMDDLPRALRLAGADLGRDSDLRARVWEAVVYPAAVAGVVLPVTWFQLALVVPTFKNIFSSFGAELPFPTQVLIDLSDFLRSTPMKSGCLLAAGLVAFVLYRRPSAARALWRRLPGLGAVYRREREARLCRLFSGLLSSGRTVEQALASCRETELDPAFARGLQAAQARVGRGEKLSAALSAAGAFSKELAWICALGEERENLPESLSWLADSHELWIRSHLEYLLPVWERSMNVAIGLLVAGIVISLFAPMFGMGDIAGAVP